LWLYKTSGTDLLGKEQVIKTPNLGGEFLAAVATNLGGQSPSPDAIFSYIYAVFYSPSYRSRYIVFIRRDHAHDSTLCAIAIPISDNVLSRI
jgi:predicted helicase